MVYKFKYLGKLEINLVEISLLNSLNRGIKTREEVRVIELEWEFIFGQS